jgi:glycosyltransferase involved in cell wall biosynthesis
MWEMWRPEADSTLQDGGPIKISIVTNAFNQGQYLAAAIDSVVSQDWPSVEYFVVDPGSTDRTPEIIEEMQRKHPGRITVITERDDGPADGLNKAFARATGDLFGYLNADDLYLPGCFKAAARAAQSNPQAAAIYADGYKANAEGRIIGHVVSTRFSPRKFVYGGALVLQQSTYYRAEAFRVVGGFNPQNRTSWDAEILLNMKLKKMSLLHVPGYWSVFRVHAESITGSQRLAEESRKTHARYFKTVMGREKKVLDELGAKLALGYTLLTEPRGLAARICNRIGAPGVDLSHLRSADKKEATQMGRL